MASEKQRQIAQKERKFLAPMASIRLQGGQSVIPAAPVRVSIIGADSRTYAPDNAVVYADGSLVTLDRQGHDAHRIRIRIEDDRPIR